MTNSRMFPTFQTHLTYICKMNISQCIQEVLDYIQYSEMEGEVDQTDSWYTTYQSLLELQEKVLDEEDILNI